MATLEALTATATRTLGARQPVDHDHLARYTFGNKALEFEVLSLFAEHVPAYLASLRDARTDKEWRDAAHTLKGSARTVGAMFVAELAERAEAFRGIPDAAAKLMTLEALSEAITEARAHIALLDPEP